MNKKMLFAAAAILFLIMASGAYIFVQKNTRITQDGPSVENTEIRSPQPPSSGVIRGKYIDYTEDGFASARGTKLLFFHAPWCPQCRALDESIKASDLPDDVVIFKVDYDSNQPLRAKYGVTLQTTVIKTDEKGDKISGYVAYDEPTFQSVKKALLP